MDEAEAGEGHRSARGRSAERSAGGGGSRCWLDRPGRPSNRRSLSDSQASLE